MKKMRLIIILLLFAFPSVGQSTNDCNIPINEKQILQNDNLDFFLNRLHKDSFEVSADRKRLPPFIKQKLYCLIDTLANEDEDCALGCMVRGDEPRRQLVFHALNKQHDVFIIVYKRGGIGISMIVMMMKLSDKGVIIDEQKNVADTWIGQTFFRGETIKELLNFLEQNRYFGGLNTNMISY